MRRLHRSTTLRTSVAAVSVLLLGVLSVSLQMTGETNAAALSVPGLVNLAGEVPALPSDAIPLASADVGRAPMNLTLVLRPAADGTEGGGRGLRYPSTASYDLVRSYFTAAGFTVLRGSSDHLTLTLRGSRSLVESSLHVGIADYREGSRTVYVNRGAPRLPSAIAHDIVDVGGLSDQSQPAPPAPASQASPQLPCTNSKGISVSDCFPNPAPGTLADSCWEYIKASFATALGGSAIVQDKQAYKCATDELNLVAAYAAQANTVRKTAGVENPHDSPTGAGQRVGLVEFGSFNLSDVSDYLTYAGADPSLINNLSVVQLGNPGPESVPAEQEILLDIDAVLTLAPGAQVVVYEAPQSDSFADVFNAMIADHDTVISNSWASCENQMSPADLNGTDLVLQAADAADISVLNAAGDSGSSCGGSPDTVSFPADDPNATAVGGSSEIQGPGGTYGSETWWNGTSNSPPTGQGGFGTSAEFTRPSYQNGYTSSSGRSVPDVVANADPADGYVICQADNGGCPTGLVYGGTSVAAPTWAAFVADLNEQVSSKLGHNLGFLNPTFYSPAVAATFHAASTMAPASDFAHVGLGSPNLDALALAIEHENAGPVSAVTSALRGTACTSGQAQTCPLDSVPADGTTTDTLVATLTDANGNTVSGKTVKLTASPGTSSVISPASGTSSVANGAVAFEVSDTVAENVTYTATDTTDGVTLAPLEVTFATPPANAGGIGASAGTVPADGTSTGTVTVTLEANGQGVAGKVVTLTQTGAAAVTGSGITGANGEATFTVTDSTVQDVNFSAEDVTDGDLSIPGTATIDFVTSTSPNACFAGTPTAASGYAFSSVISGLPYQPSSNPLDCIGPLGLAFDASGNLWTLDGYNSSISGEPTLVEIPKGGGPEQSWNLAGLEASGGYCSPAPCGPWLGLAFGKDGELYATLQGDIGEFGFGDNGGVVQLIPQAGGVITDRVVAAPTSGILNCATGIATDPLSGDLFVTTQDCAGGNVPYTVVRIGDPSSSTPTVTGYSNGCSPAPSGQCFFDGITFGPDGTIYTAGEAAVEGVVSSIPGTDVVNNTGNPWVATAVATVLNGADDVAPIDGIAVGVDPSNPTVATSLVVNRNDGVISVLNLAANPITQSNIYSGGSRGDFTTVGPDGCLYATQTDSVIRVTNSNGSCDLAATTALTELDLSPNSTTATEGGTLTLTATLKNASVPPGTLVEFDVSGPNGRVGYVPIQANGSATYTYQGINASAPFASGLENGDDSIVASLAVGGGVLDSNTASVDWLAGADATSAGLNTSVSGSTTGGTVTVTGSLTDVSKIPTEPIGGQVLKFSLGAATCSGTTDAAGLASCRLGAPTSVGVADLRVSFAGTADYAPSSAIAAFEAAAAPPPQPSGYDMVGSDGGVFVFPTSSGSGFYGSLPGLGIHIGNIVGMVPSSDYKGYFLVGSDGGVFSFGDTQFEGSLPGLHAVVNDIVGIVPTQDDKGYLLVGRDGGVFSFGDSTFDGSLPGEGIHVDDIVGIAPTNTGHGYWLVGSDGTVYPFGDAQSLGSDTTLGSPVTGIANTTIGQGYWITSANGGVASFGAATFLGSLPQLGVSPAYGVVSLVPSSDDLGYWLIGKDGGAFSFGTTPFAGSLPGIGVTVRNIVGAVPTVPN
jgi:Bacterial Ig-like domain (group 1)/Pro-kumamolisin, activation domain